MIRPNGLLLLRAMIILMATLSSLLTIYGVVWNTYYFEFVGLTLAAVSTMLLIIFADDLNKTSLIFSATLIPLALSVSYEMLSEYPLGADVHSEYFVIKRMGAITQLSRIQEESRILFGIPGYYSEVINLIFSSNLVSEILGVDPLYVIKFIWNSLILGIIPLIVFIYTHRLVEDKRSAIVSSILIYSQSTYISTLHSTVKQTVSLFLATILFLLVIKILKENRTSSDFLLLTTVVGLTGYHYLVSGTTIMILFIGLTLFYVIDLFFKSKNSRSLSEKLRIISIVVISSMAIWITWYSIVFQHIIKPVANLIISLFTLEKSVYYYEKINVPLPVLVNLIRLGINGVIVLGVLATGIMAFINTRKGSYVDSIITVASLLFLLGILSEFAGISTLGIGRISLTPLIFVVPYFYKALFFAIHKLFKPLYRKTTIIPLIVALILTLRMFISLGVASYALGEIEGAIFLDPNYRYTVSLTYADLQTASFIFDKSSVNEIHIYSDYWSRIPFIYAYTKVSCTNVTFTNYFISLSEEKNLCHRSCFIFLSSYNVVKRTIQISIIEFRDLNEYMPYIRSANSLIYQSDFTYVFK
jgi:uncharacterized membrane protein